MSFPVNSLSEANGPRFYYSDEAKTLLESHMNLLRKSQNTTVFNVKPNIAFKYAGDFFGLLADIKIPSQYRWLVMRMNGYFSSWDFDGKRITFIQPNFQEVESIINSYRAAHSTV